MLDAPGNGYLDPGETASLVTVLENFGSDAAGVTAVLGTQDPYLTVHQGTAAFGDIPEGAVADNMAEPFTLSASPATPPGHAARLTLAISHSGGTATSDFVLCVGPFDYLVWEHSTDGSSGPVLNSTLAALGYAGDLTAFLPPEGLRRYRAVFVSCGMNPDNFAINRGSPEAAALLDYLDGGGGLYLEGGDVWFEDPRASGQDFGPDFGIACQDGGTGMMPLFNVGGLAGTFTQGMIFEYGGDNFHVDQLVPIGSGFTVLEDPCALIQVGVAREDGPRRTVGTSFEFAGLVDGVSPSTKAELAQALMEFLTAAGSQSAPEEGDAGRRCAPRLLCVQANPWVGSTRLRYELPRAGRVSLDLFDATGRCVARLADGDQAAGPHELAVDGARLTPGVYWIRLRAGAGVVTGRWAVVR